ncbi:phosphoglucomutase cytoplasmic [Prunus yedoensis var. nudiflora]|uniref:Phosphoglucomutase cytoplasmic n=1 Tax=Prunus yedoensis var. nudiflora TaxID=2094558 RepID=A0A314USC0_PRUYE|nr:phosphoglucomutase cytoplasmic [Prunus yedoensis var. nudiflora]
MILGKRFFVTPSDSVAVIAANAVEALPYFSAGLKGVARSMPTSAALDVVAKHLNLKFFEFVGKKVLEQVRIIYVRKMHWATFGRHYYTRYDYENVDAGAAKELMASLVKLQSSLSEVNQIVKGIRSDVSSVVNADEFEYKDPVDGSISKHQGIRYLFEDGSRLVFRLSGTGSEGATIRLYIEQYEKDPSKIGRESQEALGPLVEVALKLSKRQEFTGRSAPTVIT